MADSNYDRPETDETYRLVVGILLLGTFLIYISVQILLFPCERHASEKRFKLHLECSKADDVRPNDERLKSTSFRQFFKRMNNLQRATLTIYVLVQLVYYVIFTFTVVSVIFFLSVRRHFYTIVEFDGVRSGIFAVAGSSLASLDEHVQEELERQTKLSSWMQSACDSYRDDLAEFLWKKIDERNDVDFRNNRKLLSNKFFEKMNSTLTQFQTTAQRFIKQYWHEMEREVRLLVSSYRTYVQKLVDNSWLMYPRSIFNRTGLLDIANPPRRIVHHHNSNHRSFRDELAFTSFLGIHQVDAVNSWQTHFTLKLQYGFEALISSFEILPPEFSRCPFEESESRRWRSAFGNSTAFADNLNSTRFFSTSSDASSSLWFKSLQKLIEFQNSDKQMEPVFNRHPDFDVGREGETFLEDDSVKTATVDSHLSSSTAEHFLMDLKEDFDSVNWNLLMCIFVTLDAILLIPRLTRLYAKVNKFCRGFKKMVVLKLTDNKRPIIPLHSRPPLKEPCDRYDNCKTETPPATNHQSSQNHTCAISKHGYDRTNEIIYEVPNCLENSKESSGVASILKNRCQSVVEICDKQLHAGVQNCASFSSEQCLNYVTLLKTPVTKSMILYHGLAKAYSWKAFVKCQWNSLHKSELVPTLILMMIVVLTIHLAFEFFCFFLQPSIILDFSGLFSVLSSISFHVNDSNDYLLSTADLYTVYVANWYKQHAVHEITSLHGVLDLFLTGLAANEQDYMSTLCDVEGDRFAETNSTCTHDTKNWNQPPILPCNFVPIQAKLFSACDQTTRHVNLKREYNQIFRSSCLIFTAFFNVVLVVFAIIVIIANAVERFFFHVIKSRDLFSVRFSTYVVSTSSPDGGLNKQETMTTCSTDTFISVLQGYSMKPHSSLPSKKAVVNFEPNDVISFSSNLPPPMSKFKFTGLSPFSETKV